MNNNDNSRTPKSGEIIPDHIVDPDFDPTWSDDDDERGLAPAMPAATIIILRDGMGQLPPDILMVRRAAHMRFAAGAAVFPGGRVDADDHYLAEQWAADLPPADGAARVAAVRETLEETGLAIGIDGLRGDVAGVLGDMRAALLSEAPFSTLLTAHGLTLDLAALTPFARWRPNFRTERVFDTRFYLARAPKGEHALHVVESENSDLFWLSAAAALSAHHAGELHMIFPTRCNIERLAEFADYSAALESAARYAPRRITPFVETRDGQSYLSIRDDCGYPNTSVLVDRTMRG